MIRLLQFNCLGGLPITERGLNDSEFLTFVIVSILMLYSLSFFWKIIPKRSIKNLHKDNSIYQSKDILLQEYKVQAEYIPAGKTTSVWVKTIVYILVLLVAITPLFELFGMQTIH